MENLPNSGYYLLFWHWIAYKSEFSRVQRAKPLVDGYINGGT
jgi:hypothetical protein